MRGITKKIVSVILAIALTITGISYTPGTAVQAAGTFTGDGYTAEISDGKTTFGNTETIEQVKYNNYIRYGATIAGKSGEDTNDAALKAGAAGAIDNDSGTRWADASSNDSGFITVDLGAAYSTKMVYINWEVANAKRYKIQYSHNGTDFTDAVSIESSGTELAYGGNRIDKITLNNEIKARYIKIQVVERCAKSNSDSTNYGGVSIWEIGMYGTSNKAVGTVDECGQYGGDKIYDGDSTHKGWKTVFGPTDDKTYNEKTLYNYLNYKKYRTATASGNGVNASHAIDGNVDTRWKNEDNTKNGQYITVNLGAEYNIAKLCISWEKAKARTYNIETSNDGVHFDTAATVRWEDNQWINHYRVDKVTLGTAVKAQYVRIYTLTRANDSWGASIWEMGIYGTDDEVGDHVYTTEAFTGYTDTIGNYIEGENYSDDLSYAAKKDTGNSQHNGGNLSGTIKGSIAGYRVHFDRKTSKVKFHYSGNSESGGKIKMYVDGTSGNPVATITTSSTGSWSDYTDVTEDVVIPCGDHKIYLVMEQDSGKTYVGNVDYFRFEYAPEDVDIEHEAENAHAYEMGSESFKHTVVDIGNGKKGIGSMNTDATKDPAYLTTYVSVDYSGKFLFKVKYSTLGETNIEYRINDGNWTKISVDAGSSDSDIKEKIVTEALQLNKGINKIDITGARDMTLSSEGWVNDWLNVDSFILQQASYDKTAFVERNRNSETLGNRIEAEEADAYDTKLTMGNGKLGHNVSDTWAQYNVYFDRKTSGIQFHYSRPSGMSAGTIEVYVDSKEGVPAGKIVNPEDTGSWDTYKDVKADITVPSGRHKIYLKFVTDNTKDGFADIDYFKFDYTPQNIDDKDQNNKNEAEDAHAYTQGTAEKAAEIEENNGFSGKKAIKNMNAWPSGRSYLTTYIYVEYPGTYTLTVGYAAGNNKTTNIDYRINTKEWTSLTAKPTGGWYTVNKLTTEVNLEKGINIVDITGASNIQYEEENAWQQVNIDYFRLDRKVDNTNIAYRKPTEAGNVQPGLTADKAVDESRDNNSRWAAADKQNWMIIDLEGMYEIEEIDILFEVAYGTDFEILFSRDKKTWVTTRTVKNFNNGDTIKNISDSIRWNSKTTDGEGNPNKGCLGKTRYIKIDVSKCGKNENGTAYNNVSIWEFVVRGEKVPGSISNVALNGTATASTSESKNIASYAIDGKNTTRWAAPNTDKNAYLTVDLGRNCELSSIDLTFERAYAKSFRIQVSNDGKTWNDAATVSGWTEPGEKNIIDTEAYKSKILSYSLHLNKVKASYVRFYTDERINTGWGVSVFEFEVWGKDLSKADYWSGWSASKYGIYPVDKLYNNTTASDGTSMGDTSIVQKNVIANEDTYEVVYEPGKEIYFYINPYGHYIDLDNEQVCWSSQSSGSNQWGADHSENIAKYGTQTDATVKYILPENIDFGTEDSVTTEIACQVWKKTDLQDNVPIDGTSPKVYIKFQLKVLKSHDIYISDTIRVDGCLNVRNSETGAQYVWQRSEDGVNWETVNEKRYDLTIVNDNGKSVNVAMDLGGGKYYRVKKSGAAEWSQPYLVPFYNNVQNGDFEFPAMYAPGEEGAKFPFNANGDEQQYPNGYPGLIWKTTGPGWIGGVNKDRVGHDIEIVNGRNLRVNESGQVDQFSVTLDEMYGDGSHGDQFAELNCENVGALYQDILTTPNSECYWDLDHAGRWNQNTMYVVAMSSQDAQAYTSKTQIAKIVDAANSKNLNDTGADDYSGQTEIELDNGVKAYVWKVMSPETKGVWAHHSGKYTVPEGEKNYLTRFFFVSAGGAKRNEGDTPNETVGNLLDNVTFEMKQSYTIEYYVKGADDTSYQLVSAATETGMVSPYDRVGIGNLNYRDDRVNLNAYTLTKAEMNETPYYIDDSGLMTVAYNHNSLKLYYDAATIAVTKKVEGIRAIPEGYAIEFALVDTSGKIWGTKTLGKGDFSKVEQNGDEAEGYFATILFQATSMGINDNTVLKIQEKLTPLVTETNSYLEKVKIDDEVNSLNTDLYEDNTEKVQYEKQFTYRTSASNSISFVNIYKSIHTVSITKEVVSKYLNVEIGNDDTFQFTLNVQKNSKPIRAFSVGEGITESSNKGKYTFALKDNENVELSVLDGCTVTVEEDDYAKAYYSTGWSGTGADLTVNGRKVTINTVDSDTALICTNENVYYGDVEVQGFQMNTDNSVGGVSEFSPSFRVVSRACKMLQGSDGELYKVTAYGTIYASDDNVRDNYNEKMRLENAGDSDYVYGTGEFSSNIYYYEAKVGTYLNWTTRQPDDPYYNYFALTFSRTSYSYPWLDTDMTFRAYARLENGEVVYGTKVYTVDIFEIAENLYQNTKLGTKEAHEFLYTNVLNLMTMSKNRVSICKSMFKALGADITDKTTDEYLRINTVNHDINDYVYCQKDYTYKDRGDFSPNNTDEKELLDMLNNARATDHKTLSDWIYNETPKLGFAGFYEKVPYDWDNSIYSKK